MKKENKKIAETIKQLIPTLVGFDDATLCGAVANLDKETIIKVAKAAERKEGNFEGLTVNNPKTKKAAFKEIIGQELAEKVLMSPSALGPIYNMVHYIQSTKFGSVLTAAEEKAGRRAEGEALAGTSCRRHSRVIRDGFDWACKQLGFDPENLTQWEEDQALEFLQEW